MTYDASTGDLLTIANPLNQSTTQTWSSGLLQTITDPLQHTTTFLYDTNRRLSTAMGDNYSSTCRSETPAPASGPGHKKGVWNLGRVPDTFFVQSSLARQAPEPPATRAACAAPGRRGPYRPSNGPACRATFTRSPSAPHKFAATHFCFFCFDGPS